jgi:hypothetical protein
MCPSDRQTQPRSLLAVVSAVKQTTLTIVQAAPLREMEPGGAVTGSVAVA